MIDSLEHIVGIDPGTSKTGICRIEFKQDRKDALAANIVEAVIVPNAEVIPYLRKCERAMIWDGGVRVYKSAVAVEGLVSYGQTWGDETIRTAYFIGRLLQYLEAEGRPFDLFSRKQYGQWLTDGGVTKDANIRSALETTYGSFKKGGPLAPLVGSTSDKRSAFALAKYYEYRLIEIGRGNGKNLPPSLYVPLERGDG